MLNKSNLTKMERSEICTLMKYEFLRRTALQNARNISNEFGCSVTTQQTVSS